MKRRIVGIVTVGAVAVAIAGVGAAGALLPTHKTAHASDVQLAVPFTHQR